MSSTLFTQSYHFMKNFILGFLLFGSIQVWSQVPKKIVVEHFTNTKCGICAQKNPGFIDVLNNHSEVIHLSIHPSSPYSTCAFNEHNPSENDQRTYYYDIYGGTPRLVIQGQVQPTSTDFDDASLFDSFEDETSNFSIELRQEYFTTQNFIQVTVLIKKESESSLGNAYLYAALAEGLINYDAPNGESEHYDVFRKSVFETSGKSISLPQNIGDTVQYSAVLNIHSDWDQNELYTIAILQSESDKSVLQSESAKGTSILSVAEKAEAKEVRIYPNPSTGILQIDGLNSGEEVVILNNLGQFVYRKKTKGSSLDLSILPAGMYFIELSPSESIECIRKPILIIK